tara:strand:+ start:1086 stop:1805 length:720 start_codon:yes stop_codon:yes gene_type:complete
MKSFNPNAKKIGGYSENDGTIDFYSRINCLINKNSEVLDFGAGRGAWAEDENIFRKKTRNLKGKVKKVYACDIDKAVYLNKNVDEILEMENGNVIGPSESMDIIIADYVLEHIENPYKFFKEIDRLLKPGGWFCARTPHKYNLVSIFAMLIRNDLHSFFLKYVQPDRKEIDIFPTHYRLNTLKKLKVIFKKYDDCSFIHRSDPSYYFGKKHIFYLQKTLSVFIIDPLIGNLFIYKQKPF